jgi:hypothetical protein
MRRREFITLLGGATIAWPLAARAQQRERMRRVGVLTIFGEAGSEPNAWLKAFQTKLQKLGWEEGRTILASPWDRVVFRRQSFRLAAGTRMPSEETTPEIVRHDQDCSITSWSGP